MILSQVSVCTCPDDRSTAKPLHTSIGSIWQYLKGHFNVSSLTDGRTVEMARLDGVRTRQVGQDEERSTVCLVYRGYYIEQEREKKNVWATGDGIVASLRQARSVTGPHARSQQRRTWSERV